MEGKTIPLLGDIALWLYPSDHYEKTLDMKISAMNGCHFRDLVDLGEIRLW